MKIFATAGLALVLLQFVHANDYESHNQVDPVPSSNTNGPDSNDLVIESDSLDGDDNGAYDDLDDGYDDDDSGDYGKGSPYTPPASQPSEPKSSYGGRTRQPNNDYGPSSKDQKPNVSNGGRNLHPYSPEIRDYIVEKHNWARGFLVPSEAANMRKLNWDESLAIEASELVETCNFSHDTENYAYGQNLMYGGRTLDKPLIDSWMKMWVSDELSPQDKAGTGMMDLDHASAVLWANSYLVGCASKMCPNGYLTACNYYSPGNWQGEKTYIPGKSCSQCPSQAPYCDATGKLCTAERGDGPAPAPAPAPGPNPAPTPAPTSGKPVGPAPAPQPYTPAPPQPQPQPAVVTPCPSSQNVSGKPTPAPSTPQIIKIYGDKDQLPTPAPTSVHHIC